MADFDPFSQRQQIPDYPSVFGANEGATTPQQGAAIADYYSIGGNSASSGHMGVTGAGIGLPDVPPESMDLGSAMSDDPNAVNEDQQGPQPFTHPDVPFISGLHDFMDSIDEAMNGGFNPVLDPIIARGQQGSEDQQQQGAHTEGDIGAPVTGREWMFRGPAGRNSQGPAPVTFPNRGNFVSTIGSGPVKFNNTNSSDWFSAGAGTYQPRAASTQRFYQREANRGTRQGNNRVNRLFLRTQPGAPLAGQ